MVGVESKEPRDEAGRRLDEAQSQIASLRAPISKYERLRGSLNPRRRRTTDSAASSSNMRSSGASWRPASASASSCRERSIGSVPTPTGTASARRSPIP